MVGQEEVSGQVCKCASGARIFNCNCNCREFNNSDFDSIYPIIQRGVEGRNGSEGTVGVYSHLVAATTVPPSTPLLSFFFFVSPSTSGRSLTRLPKLFSLRPRGHDKYSSR